jgi:hypothetical protein
MFSASVFIGFKRCAKLHNKYAHIYLCIPFQSTRRIGAQIVFVMMHAVVGSGWLSVTTQRTTTVHACKPMYRQELTNTHHLLVDYLPASVSWNDDVAALFATSFPQLKLND